MKKIFLFILLGITAVSCIKDPAADNGSGAGREVKARLIIPAYDRVNTKVTEENTINDVWILQYIDSTLVEKTNLPASTSWFTGFNLPARNMPAGPGNAVYFFSNTTVNGTDPLGTEPAFTLGESTISDLESYQFPVTEASFAVNLPMRGEYRGAIGIGVTTDVAVTLTRMAVRIDFTFDATALNQFVASSIQLCQVPNITVLPINAFQPPLRVDGTTAANPVGFTPYPAGDVFANYAEHPIPVNLTEQGSFSWYMAENARGSFPSVASNADKYPASATINDAANELKYTFILLKGSCIDSTGTLVNVSYKIYLGGNSTGDMNLIANTIYSVTTTLTGTNTADTRITAVPVDIIDALAPSNCYILNANGGVQIFFIPLSQAVSGIAAVNATANVPVQLVFNPTSGWSADILWQTWQAASAQDQLIVSRATGNGGINYIRVTLPPGIQNGNNALVALRDAGGNILWSWHLWITDYNPYTSPPLNGEVHAYNGTAFLTGTLVGETMLDRNLGATWTGSDPAPVSDPAAAARAYGLLYQWGRKDPFTPADGLSTTTPVAVLIYGGAIGSPALTEGTGTGTGINKVSIPAVTRNNLVNAVQNPTTFYFDIAAPFDWYTNVVATPTNQNNNLWTNRPSAKSFFDPCPPGYRVPDGGNFPENNPWVGFGTTGGNGLLEGPSNNFVWYANGLREGATGTTQTDATGGRLYEVNSINAWYPAEGYRHYSSGEFATVGNFGNAWSASLNGAPGYYLGLAYNVGRPLANSNRAFGFGIRCVTD